jgi:hypothetical protein
MAATATLAVSSGTGSFDVNLSIASADEMPELTHGTLSSVHVSTENHGTESTEI